MVGTNLMQQYGEELFKDDLSDPSPAQSVGFLLRQTREYLGFSLEQISTKIRVRSFYLDALERGDLAEIPGNLYISGFVRLYAKILDLDGEELLRRMNFCLEPAPLEERPVYLSSRLQLNKFAIFLSFGIGISSLFLMYVLFFWKEHTSQPIPPVMEVSMPSGDALLSTSSISHENSNALSEQKEADVMANISDQTIEVQNIGENSAQEKTQAETILAPAAQNNMLILDATEDCWLEIFRGKEVIFSRVLKKGEAFSLNSPKECTLSVGNAGGLFLRYGKKTWQALGQHGHVMRGIVVSEFLEKESKND